MAEGVCSRSARKRLDRRLRKAGHRSEWPGEWIENAIELNAHLISKSPSGIVVGRRGRSTRVWNVVRVILRLKHVQDVRPECLSSLNDERVGRVALALNAERRGRTQNDDA